MTDLKQTAKRSLSLSGILPFMEIVRSLPTCLRWLRNGGSGGAPHPFKRMVISAYMRRFQLERFVETGTHYGDTLAEVAFNKKIKCTSIELSSFYAQIARERFQSYPNVEILEGDSGLLIPQVVEELKCPALFWLDGHYSDGNTAKGLTNTPITQELEAILTSPIQGHVVLIDDIRYFDGTQDYPHLDTVLRNIREKSRFQAEVSMDIARLTPR